MAYKSRIEIMTIEIVCIISGRQKGSSTIDKKMADTKPLN